MNRKIDAIKRQHDPELQIQFRIKEKLRKREQREKKKSKKNPIISKIRRNSKYQRANNVEKLKTVVSELNLKIKMFENTTRKLKRKLKIPTSNSSMIEEKSDKTCDIADKNTTLIGCVSPRSKKRAVRRLKLNNISPTISPLKRDLNLDRLKVKPLGRPSITKEKVNAFLENDENTIVVPDVKKSKNGICYRMMSIKDLHLKFITDNDVECSYQHFARQVPDNIIKPKPEDWGTCLCMLCLNPELKLECIKRYLQNVTLTLDNLTDKDYEEEIKSLYKELKESDVIFEYLEWSREKVENEKSVSYFSQKNPRSKTGVEMASEFKNDIEILSNHANRFRSQYRRIGEIKKLVADPLNCSKLLRVDWSENVELFQTRQEKSQFYSSITASVNAAVLYSHDGVQSIGTISDVKCHKAQSTWTSLREMFKEVDLTETKTLYIASDSPTSQYRNRWNVFLTKKWAVENKIDVHWIFTEAGHGKGPMDGVGSTIKRAVKDTIAYHPNSVISNSDQLLKHLKIHDVIIGTYKDDDVKNISSKLPTPGNLHIIKSGYGLAKVHEIYFSKVDDNIIKWKKMSSDSLYSSATIKVKGFLKEKYV